MDVIEIDDPAPPASQSPTAAADTAAPIAHTQPRQQAEPRATQLSAIADSQLPRTVPASFARLGPEFSSGPFDARPAAPSFSRTPRLRVHTCTCPHMIRFRAELAAQTGVALPQASTMHPRRGRPDARERERRGGEESSSEGTSESGSDDVEDAGDAPPGDARARFQAIVNKYEVHTSSLPILDDISLGTADTTGGDFRGGAEDYDLQDPFIDDSEIIHGVEARLRTDAARRESQRDAEEGAGECKPTDGLTLAAFRCFTIDYGNDEEDEESSGAEEPGLSSPARKSTASASGRPSLKPHTPKGDSAADAAQAGKKRGRPRKDGPAAPAATSGEQPSSTAAVTGPAKPPVVKTAAPPTAAQLEEVHAKARREEEAEFRRREFLEEHQNKPWNVSPQLEAALRAYEAAVKKRNRALKPDAPADMTSSPSASTQVFETQASTLDDGDAAAEVRVWRPRGVGIATRLLSAFAALIAPRNKPEYRSFPAELDLQLAHIDNLTRSGNKNQRLSPYFARLMKIRGFPSNRETIKTHILRSLAAEAVYEAACDMDASLETFQREHILRRLREVPDMQATAIARGNRRSEQREDPRAPATQISSAAPSSAAPLSGPLGSPSRAPSSSDGAAPPGTPSNAPDPSWFAWDRAMNEAWYALQPKIRAWITAENTYRTRQQRSVFTGMGVPSQESKAFLRALDIETTLYGIVFPEVAKLFPAGSMTPRGLRTVANAEAARAAKARELAGIPDPGTSVAPAALTSAAARTPAIAPTVASSRDTSPVTVENGGESAVIAVNSDEEEEEEDEPGRTPSLRSARRDPTSAFDDPPGFPWDLRPFFSPALRATMPALAAFSSIPMGEAAMCDGDKLFTTAAAAKLEKAKKPNSRAAAAPTPVPPASAAKTSTARLVEEAFRRIGRVGPPAGGASESGTVSRVSGESVRRASSRYTDQ